MIASARAFVALRRSALAATAGFIDSQSAAQRLGALYERGASFGMVHELVRRDGEVVAQLAFFRDPAAWFGGPVVLAWIDRAPGDEASLAPLLEHVDRHLGRLDDTTLIELRVDDGPLLSALVARGFGIDSVIQVGDPARALAALGADDRGNPLRAHGLTLVPSELRHLPEILALHRAVFSAEPEWCWFGAFEPHLERMRRDLSADLEGHFALVDDHAEVVGHLGADLSDNPYFGMTGGLELVLPRRLRSLGLARPMYRVALASLVARGARTIKGGTSQPGVLALGRVMQRPWHAFNLRRGAPFSPAHFLRFAPEAVRRVHHHVG